MKIYKITLLTLIVWFFAVLHLMAQTNPTDTTINSAEESAIQEQYLQLTKSPTAACLRSLIFPGWGQLYVEHYIQAPVFFGAAGFLWYNIISNHISYKDYQTEATKYEDKESYEYQVANSKMIAAVDNRDLSILYLLGVYVLSIVDAYSGAHLYDFKIVNKEFQWYLGANTDLTGTPNFRFGLTYKFKK